MTEQQLLGYEAAIGTEWRPLSDQHSIYLDQVNNYIGELSKGNRNVLRTHVVTQQC